ncbi:peptidoglycan-binding protein [Nonomuraea sp. NPDC005983]|uniref:peptidoglycan-binding protein n=1 Tax=Nonomuraea sp. NPDC005983 TaxID=3155595 RepID=UPI0033A9443B
MRKLLIVLGGVLAIAGAGWGVGTQLRSPADEAAARTPPRPSLITVPVERRKLVSTVVVAGTVAYGSPLPITLAGVVGGDEDLQRVTRAPRPGRVTEGAVLMEVNGRPVFAFTGRVPMHRTLTPGARGDDVRQLQKALRAPASGVFDRATIAAVTRFYARKGYEAQRPTIAARQQRDTLRRTVQTARETLLTEQKALDQGRDVLPLKIKLNNARQDLRAAKRALDGAAAESSDAARETAEAAVRAAQEKVLAAEQELAAARATPTTPPAATPTPAPSPPDTQLLELRLANARAELEAARSALSRVGEEARRAWEKRMDELRKTVRDARGAVVAAEQELRQARQLSPVKLRLADARRDLASASSILAEFERTYGTTVPSGEVVFLPKLPAHLRKATAKAGRPVDEVVATVTSSTFMITGAADPKEAELVKKGMEVAIETQSGKSVSGVVRVPGESVRITPSGSKGLKSGDTVTARITVGATDREVLIVPVAAVITAADGRARVLVETATDRTREVEVRTGLTADGAVEVTGDLRPGDRVVVNRG